MRPIYSGAECTAPFEREGWWQSKEVLHQSQTETKNKLPTPVALCPIPAGLRGPILPALLTATHSSIQGWFHSLYAALLDRHSRALTSPTQSRLHLHIFTQWSPYRDSPATPGFGLSLTGASIAPYSPILKTLKSELQGPCCQVCLPTRDTTYLLITFE